MKKTFDAVAFMRKRREELSRAYANLSAEQLDERVQEALRDTPLWKQRSQVQGPASAKTRARKRSGCP